MFYAAAFSLFCVVCTLFAFTRHPIWGVYFYLATTYVFPPGRWWGFVFGDLRWAFLSACITVLAVMFHRGKLQPKRAWITTGPVIFFGLYILWMVVQSFWALAPDEHIRGTAELVKCMFSMWFVYRAVDSKDRLRELMLAHVMGCALLGIYAQFTGRTGGRLDGVGGPNLDDSNTLGMYLVTAAICASGLVMAQKGWRRYVALACLPLIVNGFVLANSRGGLLGLVAGGLVFAWCASKEHRWVLWAFALAGALGLSVLVDQTFIDRMFTIGDVASESEDADQSARSRLVIVKAQLEMFYNYPMGIGWRGTEVLSPQYMDERWLTPIGAGDVGARSSHNTFMTALTEQGIPGALIYVGLAMWVLAAIFRTRRMRRLPAGDPDLTTLAASLCGAIVAILVSGMTADYLTKEVQFWLYAGLVSVFWLSDKSVATQVERRVGREPLVRPKSA
jgi:hypothetical protein